MIATGGNFGRPVRKWVGSGMIRLACNVSPLRDSGFVSPWALARFVNVTVAPVPPGSLVRVGQRKRIAGLVLPGLKVHGLAWADTQQDSQNFQIGYLLSERGIEAGAALPR